ncbi:MAG: FG-GAP repeat protein, partial [Alphaproteobacteria bacterium]|nr:FG-GAP repeat protein [Alphaproteobacteria bacterium]
LQPVLGLDGETIAGSCDRTWADADAVLYGENGSQIGEVFGAGDVDGDGHADVVTGRGYGTPRTAVTLWTGVSTGRSTEADATGVWQTSSLTYTTMGAVGDANGTGSLFTVRAARLPGDTNNVGAIHLLDGSAISGDPRADAVATLHGTFSKSLGGVAPAGDVDGDGFDDFWVGAPTDLSGTGDGYSYLFRGPLAGGTLDVASTANVTFQNTAALSSGSGTAAARFGDVNGDGITDAVIGQVWASDLRGVTYVVHGPLSGSYALPAQADAVIRGSAQARFGRLGLAVVDVDGDGFDDLVAGAERDGANGTEAGAVFVIRGSASGLPSGDARSLAWMEVRGREAGDRLGDYLDAVDLDGDGDPDLVAGAKWARGHAGQVVVFRDFRPGVFTLDDADVALDFQAGEEAGRVHVLGDVDGDGHTDLGVAAVGGRDPGRPGESGHGAAYLFYGPF